MRVIAKNTTSLTIASVLIACATWCVTYGLYIDHVNNAGARYWGIDTFIPLLASVGRLDKVAAPFLALAFVEWWSMTSDALIIGAGLLCGGAFGAIGGTYLVACALGRAFQRQMFIQPIAKTIRTVTWVYVVASWMITGLGAWYLIGMIAASSTGKTARVVLLYGGASCVATLCLYAGLAWVAFWCVVAGQQLARSLNLLK